MFLEIFNFHTIGHQRGGGGGGGGYSASRSLEPRPSSPFMPTSKESRQKIQKEDIMPFHYVLLWYLLYVFIISASLFWPNRTTSVFE